MRKNRTPSASLERQVIVSVVVLYLLICTAMLAIHYSFGHAPTATSSTSPSHAAIVPEQPAGKAGPRP